MAIVPEWWSEYLALNASGSQTIRDASGNLVVFDPDVPAGVNPVQDLYVANDFSLPAPFLTAVATTTPTGNTVGLPQAPINAIAAQFNVIIPGDDVGSILGRVVQAAEAIWGSAELGQVRHSSGYMPSDPTSGVRAGSIIAPRVMLPPWAASRNGRG